MDLSSRKGEIKGNIVAGSVWETRMKNGEVKNVSIVEENSNGGDKGVSLKKGQTVVNVGVNNGKRKIWKNESFEGLEKNPVQISKGNKTQIGVAVKGRSLGYCKDLSLSPVQVKKGRSEGIREVSKSVDGIERSSIYLKKSRSEITERNSVRLLRKTKSDNEKVLVLDDQKKANHVSIEENEKNGSEFEFEENCKEFGVCQEMTISSNTSNGDVINSSHEASIDDDDSDDNFEDDEEFFEDEEEIENEKKSFEIKEMHVPKKKSPETEPENAVKKLPQTRNNLQNLVDLIMWRDASKSTLVFGMGTFIIISTSYTQDFNVSFISTMSYMCLVYLAAIFLYRSLVCRGVVDVDESNYVVGEEEVSWLLNLILPYLNEFLIKLKALFSGDPATTMKLAVLLFVLARCGSYITIWKMIKLGFFGVFIVPKVCSAYSHQLTAYGKFWVRRFRDAWDSCTHKKAVAVAIFTLVWNLCSIVARIWAAFVLFVALRYYQQKMVTDDCVEDEDGPSLGPTLKEPIERQ